MSVMGKSAQRIGLPFVALAHVKVSLGGRTIQNDMSFRIEDGEFIAVLGPNGAGKSTLLKVMLGLVRPAAGPRRNHGAGAGKAKRADRVRPAVPRNRVGTDASRP